MTYKNQRNRKTAVKDENKRRLCSKKQDRFRMKLRVKAAPDPSVINWPHYYEKTWKETLLNSAIWLFILLWLFFTYLVCFALREYIIGCAYSPKCVD